MQPAESFNPIKHPRRLERLREAHLAQRAKALAPSLCAPRAAERLGISRTEAEQLAARHGFSFLPSNEK